MITIDEEFEGLKKNGNVYILERPLDTKEDIYVNLPDWLFVPYIKSEGSIAVLNGLTAEGCVKAGSYISAECGINAERIEAGSWIGACVIEARDCIEAGSYILAECGIKAGGYIKAERDIDARWGISAGGDIKAGGNIKAGWGISAGGDVKLKCDFKVGYGIEAGGCIYAGGDIKAVDGIKAKGDIKAKYGVSAE